MLLYHQPVHILRHKPRPLPGIALYIITRTPHRYRIKRNASTTIEQPSTHQLSFRIKIITICFGLFHIFIIQLFTVILLHHLYYQPALYAISNPCKIELTLSQGIQPNSFLYLIAGTSFCHKESHGPS